MRPSALASPCCCSAQVLQQHGKQLHSILFTWNEEAKAADKDFCGRMDFRRAAQALGALGIAARVPTELELDAMFDVMSANLGGEQIEIAALLKPLEPHSFMIEEVDEDFDPDDCFEELGSRCMACNAYPEDGKKLLACQRCRHVKYCSRACQLTGWRRGHKESCGKPLPRPSQVAGGSPEFVMRVLREFHAAHGALTFACLSRLGALALDPLNADKSLQHMVDMPGGIEAVVMAMQTYAGASELILPGYMLLCAFCSTSRTGAAAVVKAGGLQPLIDLFKVSVHDAHLLTAGLRAMKRMAETGPTAKQALIDGQGVYGIVWSMREHQDDVPLLMEAVHALGNIGYRGGADIRSYLIKNSGVEGICAIMRKHIDAEGKNEELALQSVTALRMFIAGDDTGIICGSAADVAHTMTTAMAKYLGIEAVVDAMMYHQGNEMIQEHGAAVIANVASVDLGAKRQHEVVHGSEVADTQATVNLVDSLIPVVKAIKRFPRLGSPRHALHVITANLGSPKEALEAGADPEWLPLPLQYSKDKGDKL